MKTLLLAFALVSTPAFAASHACRFALGKNDQQVIADNVAQTGGADFDWETATPVGETGARVVLGFYEAGLKVAQVSLKYEKNGPVVSSAIALSELPKFFAISGVPEQGEPYIVNCEEKAAEPAQK